MKLKNPMVRKIVGLLLVIIGVVALLTPLTPGSWLAIIGLQLLGWGGMYTDKIKQWLPGFRKPPK